MSHAKASHQYHEDHEDHGANQASEDNAHEGPESHHSHEDHGKDQANECHEGHEGHEGQTNEDPAQKGRPAHGCAMVWQNPLRKPWMQELDLCEKKPVVCQVHPMQATMGELTPSEWHPNARHPVFTTYISSTKTFPTVCLAEFQTKVLHLDVFIIFSIAPRP